MIVFTDVRTLRVYGSCTVVESGEVHGAASFKWHPDERLLEVIGDIEARPYETPPMQHLSGPSITRVLINGYDTTIGELMSGLTAQNDGRDTPAVKLAGAKLRYLELRPGADRATGNVSVHEAWMSPTFDLSARQSRFTFPTTTFNSLSIDAVESTINVGRATASLFVVAAACESKVRGVRVSCLCQIVACGDSEVGVESCVAGCRIEGYVIDGRVDIGALKSIQRRGHIDTTVTAEMLVEALGRQLYRVD